MRKEDLMLGDWVEVTQTECVADGGHYITWSEYGKITGITDSYIEVEVRDGEYNVDAHEDELKPIPLTPEILEENGFIGDKNVCKTKVRDDSKDELWQCEYAWYLKNLRIKNRTNGSVARLYNIMFVHELQHALRLCGINKEIKL